MTRSSDGHQCHSVQLPQHAGNVLADGDPRTPAALDSHPVVLPVFVEPIESAGDGYDGVLVAREIEDLEPCLDQRGKSRVCSPGLNGISDDLSKKQGTSEHGVQKRVSLYSPTLKASLNILLFSTVSGPIASVHLKGCLNPCSKIEYPSILLSYSIPTSQNFGG
jgi:hypothetical protein